MLTELEVPRLSIRMHGNGHMSNLWTCLWLLPRHLQGFECLEDRGFLPSWGYILVNLFQNSLKELVGAGVVGFKCFLCPSGVEEFPNVEREDLENAFVALEGTGSLLAVSY